MRRARASFYQPRIFSQLTDLVNDTSTQHVSILPSSLQAILILLLTGCVSVPTADELIEPPAPHLSSDAPPGIVDGRARFRTYFCDASAECGSWLHQLPDEPARQEEAIGTRSDLHVLFVTGAFSECFGESAKPFADAIEDLHGSSDRFGT